MDSRVSSSLESFLQAFQAVLNLRRATWRIPQAPLAGTTVLELATMGDVGDARVPVWLDCDPGIALRDGMVQDANASPTLLLLR